MEYGTMDTVCGECIEVAPSSQRKATQCLCGEGPVAVNSMIQCVKCIRWWHPGCVGLKGLTKHGCNSIIEWHCPPCFNLAPEVKDKIGEGSAQNDSSPVDSIKEEVRKGVEAAMPGMLEKIQEQYTTQLESFKTEATQFVGKTWADVAKSEQKKIMTEVAQNTSESALKQSMSFINTNMTEMRNRVNNIIIYNVKEESDEDVVASVHTLIQPVADVPRSDIVKAVRLGKLVPVNDRIRERVILVTLRHEEDSKFLHNYKAGRRVELPDNRGQIWINADLTKTERDAAFQLRKQRKARREAGTAATAARGGIQAAPLVNSVPAVAAHGGRIPATPVQATAAAQPAAPQQGETQSNK